MPYKLRCSMHGHASDVRGVAAAEDTIVSASRDLSAKLWTPIEFDNGYRESLNYCSHTNFVSAVAVLPPCDVYPRGLVLTGSSDKSICAYTFDSPNLIYRLIGHENTVCSLTVGKFGTIVSGSWDNTGKVWLNQKCMMTLKGHSGSVWAVALISQSGLTITGSADKTIKIWRAGKCERTLTGHTDCVRAIAVLSDVSFLSASNDATIRKWLITGECETVIQGHDNYIYSIAVLSPAHLEFASVSEDRSLRIWTSGKCCQVIRLPAQSVWSVAALSNGDIVTGSSDGVVRVFSHDHERQASVEELKAFEEEVASSTISTGEIAGLKINDLPGREVLYEQGKRDGQTKLIRNGSKVEVYQWNAEEIRWTKVGDALGSEGATTSSNKVHYEGKEYDYVFDVDIQEGKPSLKLPYNITEDPWFAAQKFLEKNDISQMFLDQVAQFIMKNTKGLALSSMPQTGYEDPFTGQSRYRPEAASASSNFVQSSDPFTGSGRYIPPSSTTTQVSATSNNFFPIKTVLTFDSSNLEAIKGKLLEFWRQQMKEDEELAESTINGFLNLTNSSAVLSNSQMEIIERLSKWPENFLFPVLDALRLIIRNFSVNERLCGEQSGHQFFEMLLQHIHHYKSNSPVNCILSLKLLCNMSSQPWGKRLLIEKRSEIVESIMQLAPCDNKNIQIAFATVLLNLSVLIAGTESESEREEAGCQCLSAVAQLLLKQLDPEAGFRLLVAAGTLLSDSPQNVAVARSLDLTQFVTKWETINEPKKVGDCARLINKILN